MAIKKMRDSNLTLGYGKFIGRLRREIHAERFSFAEIVDRIDEEVRLHSHSDAHFLLVLEGSYITSARNMDRICSAGSLIFNPAGTTHRDHFQTRGGRFFTISIRPEHLAQIELHTEFIDYATGLPEGPPAWLATRLYRELGMMDPFSPLAMEGMTLELLAHMLRRQGGLEKATPPWLQVARELIQDRCTESFTLAEIARSVGVHPLHLTRCFRKFFHCTPGEYLRQCRLQEASALLRRSHASLAEVALESGFMDQSQFTKSFKRGVGMTPGAFRKAFGS